MRWQCDSKRLSCRNERRMSDSARRSGLRVTHALAAENRSTVNRIIRHVIRNQIHRNQSTSRRRRRPMCLVRCRRLVSIWCRYRLVPKVANELNLTFRVSTHTHTHRKHERKSRKKHTGIETRGMCFDANPFEKRSKLLTGIHTPTLITHAPNRNAQFDGNRILIATANNRSFELVLSRTCMHYCVIFGINIDGFIA